MKAMVLQNLKAESQSKRQKTRNFRNVKNSWKVDKYKY